MNRGIVILLLTIAAQLAMTGCRDKKLSEQERKEAELRQCCAEIEQGIKDHGVALRQTNCNPAVCSEKLFRQISALPQRDLQRKFISDWADDVYSFDLGSLHRDKTSHATAVWLDIRNFTEGVMRIWAGDSFEDKWDAYLRYFKWCRTELGKMRVKRPYPKAARPTWTLDGDIHWKIDKDGRNDYQEFIWWLENYNDFTAMYEEKAAVRESWSFASDCKSVSTARADVIRAKLESFFGRKLRTWEEAEKDLNAKRRLEFPAYVATPEGIRECWTKAEEEAAKKKVK